MIALSFDDTPSPYTEAIYRTLLRYRVKATFFVIGERIPGRARLLRAMVDSGMELGNHSYTHPPGLATEGAGASRRACHGQCGDPAGQRTFGRACSVPPWRPHTGSRTARQGGWP